jgi:hypothetical protein
MVRRTLNLLVAGVIALGAMGSRALPAAEQDRDSWRYRVWNNQWWYWTAEQRWVYWQNNRWNDYRGSSDRVGSRVRADAAAVSTQGPSHFTLSSSSASPGQPAGAMADSAIGPSQRTSALSRGNYADTGLSNVGPVYGHAMSSTAPRASLPNAEIRPYFGHASSTVDPDVDRSVFLGY